MEIHMTNFEQSIRDFVREGFHHSFGQPKLAVRPDPEWAKIRATGTRLWLDTGDLDEASKLWNSSFDALTTNNTLLNKEIQKGIYDRLVKKSADVVSRARPGLDDQELILEIAFILNAYHGLRLVEQFDANVSVELHTDLSHDVERAVAYGKRFFAICPERFYVKVPLTPAGLLSARKLVQAGIPINFTLGFSARQNYVAALITKPSFVNVFMGRLNSYVSDHKLGSGEFVGEKATLATQRKLLALRKSARTTSKLIGASIRSGDQIAMLAGLDVLTMPTKAAAEYRKSPLQQVVAKLDADPEIPLAAGVSLADFNGSSLWDVSPEIEVGVECLLKKNIDSMSADDIHNFFLSSEMGDVFPAWSQAEVDLATRDGKIPAHATWKRQLSSGKIGLDALMNLSALQSFVTDQKALDDRIRAQLA